MNEEDSSNLLIGWLRDRKQRRYSSYGYDVYLPNLVRIHLEKKHGNDGQKVEVELRELMPVFFAAGWELCRRGILRPVSCNQRRPNGVIE